MLLRTRIEISMRFDPQLLRTASQRRSQSTEIKTGESLMVAILEASESLPTKRLSFLDSMSAYNPLGQFFAAHQREER